MICDELATHLASHPDEKEVDDGWMDGRLHGWTFVSILCFVELMEPASHTFTTVRLEWQQFCGLMSGNLIKATILLVYM